MKEKSNKILNMVIVGLGVWSVVGWVFLFVKNKKQVSKYKRIQKSKSSTKICRIQKENKAKNKKNNSIN